jgi:Domain of unknown function (DUF3471)/Domain of unknown function (DUF4440)
MKRRTFLGVAGPALTGTVAATLLAETTAGAPASGANERAVLELEREWMGALVRRDQATLTRLMADDFKRIEAPSPNFSMPKRQWIGNAVGWYRIESFKLLSSSVRFEGQAAVVASRYRWRGALGEVPLNETVTAEDTWELRSGGWQVVSQLVRKTDKMGRTSERGPARKAIPVDPALYAAYVGQYQFGPSRVLTIRLEGGRLLHQGSGGQVAELFPETPTRFFRADSTVLTTFVTKGGRVTHVVHLHTNGRESIGKRIA